MHKTIKACPSLTPALLAICMLAMSGVIMAMEQVTYTNTLLAAAKSGNVTELQVEIAKGVNIDAHEHLILVSQQSGFTALHWAAKGGHTELVQTLLSHSANAKLKDSFGRIPLHIAALNGNDAVVQQLVEHNPELVDWCGSFYSPLYIAAFENQSSTVKLLQSLGGDVNKVDSQGSTPLHLAAEAGNTEVVRTLIELGANKHLKDHGNFCITPLEIAEKYNHPDVISLLR